MYVHQELNYGIFFLNRMKKKSIIMNELKIEKKGSKNRRKIEKEYKIHAFKHTHTHT